jgi:hypothetical protein|tara:strand:- start:917 stop:1549 length:633 start_codon:yes stop_codon:yes gene_type:complete
MALISSYPLLTPQLGDKILGSNIYDASGTAVTNNPTCQFNFTDVKTLVDQNFVSQHTTPYFTSSAITITPVNNTTGTSIKFGTVDIGGILDNVNYIANTNTFSFIKPGTYNLQLTYNTKGTGGNDPKFAFITKNAAGDQIGPTVIDQTHRQNTVENNKIITINIMLNVTSISSYQFWCLQVGTSGTLVVDALASGWTDVPSAGITISKLI